MLNKLLKSVLNQDTAPVVVCDIDDIIVYMNPSAVERYHKDLTGKSIKDCHPPKANEMIDMGIALCHFDLTAKENNLNVVFEQNNPKIETDAEYIASFRLV